MRSYPIAVNVNFAASLDIAPRPAETHCRLAAALVAGTLDVYKSLDVDGTFEPEAKGELIEDDRRRRRRTTLVRRRACRGVARFLASHALARRSQARWT